MNKSKTNTQKLVLAAIFTALVIVLQFMGSFIKFGPFAISLVLVPIVIGAAMCGSAIGAWLGVAFGVVVLWSGDAAPFLTIDIPGTVITVLLKGLICGLLAGIAYKVFEKFNRYLAVLAAAIVCPVANTGVFLLGCRVFFMDAIREWASAEGVGILKYVILFLVGGNFLFELGFNIVLSPVIVRLLDVAKKKK